jgi:hypothetical protein
VSCATSYFEKGLLPRERLEGLREKLLLRAIREGAGTHVPILVTSGDLRIVERVGAGRH